MMVAAIQCELLSNVNKCSLRIRHLPAAHACDANSPAVPLWVRMLADSCHSASVAHTQSVRLEDTPWRTHTPARLAALQSPAPQAHPSAVYAASQNISALLQLDPERKC